MRKAPSKPPRGEEKNEECRMKNEKCHPDGNSSLFTSHSSLSPLPLGGAGGGLPLPHREGQGGGSFIFDLDGTLLDTLDDLWASVNHALASFSLPLRSRIEVRQFLGNGAKVLIHKSLPEDSDKTLEEQVLSTFRQHYLLHSLDQTHPYEGIIPLLQQCKALGLKTAIVSNKPHAAVQELHQHFFPTLIDLAIGEQQPNIRRKPNPDMVLKAMEQLEVSPDSCIYIGDSEVDIETAQNAHIPCIAVSWGFRDKSFLQSFSVPIIDSPKEIWQYI
jgi:phosphoglycolate phosphatase